MRETDGLVLDTPERRAGLERRLREVGGQIADETLRRHYQQELADRLAKLLGRDASRSANGRPPGGDGRAYGQRRGGGFASRPGASGPLRVGPSLANSPLFRGVRAPIAPREGLILLILMNHPELLAERIDEVAELDFASPQAGALRDALVRWREAGGEGTQLLADFMEESGLSAAAERLVGMVAHAALWSVRPEAAAADAAESLRQALVLHRRARALNSELREVEARLADTPNERDAARLRDIQTQLSALDGAEAALEGFGALSGRPSRSL
jgi:DNA primase